MEMEDILGEVLLHLPVKALIRCRCLSKKWDNYISFNSYFRRRYLSMLNSSPSMLGFFSNNDTQVRFIPTCNETNNGQPPLLRCFDPSLKFLGHQRVFVVGSSNGFLLCCLEQYNPLNYYVCNPITEKWVALPIPTKTSWFVSTGFICQANHRRRDRVKYNVVRGVCLNATTFYTNLTFEIFSSESFVWEVFSVTCSILFQLVWKRGPAIVNEEGVIHCLAMTESYSPGVVVFDPREENLQFIEVPEEVHGFEEWISESGGQILFSHQNRSELEMCVLGVGYNGKREWTLKCRVNLKTMGSRFPEIRTRHLSIIGGHPNNPQMVFVAVPSLNPPATVVRKIFCYDMEKSKLEFVCDMFGKDFMLHGFYGLFICLATIPLIRLWDRRSLCIQNDQVKLSQFTLLSLQLSDSGVLG